MEICEHCGKRLDYNKFVFHAHKINNELNIRYRIVIPKSIIWALIVGLVLTYIIWGFR